MASPTPTVDLTFPHPWTAEILPRRPLILPARRFTYPAAAEEVEEGALELLVRPAEGEPFLATCALGFDDPAVPSGLWSCPDPDWLCAVSGGYAYLLDTAEPNRFLQIPWRPVLGIRSLPEQGLLLFTGHHALLAWGRNGEAWQSPRLSAEGIRIDRIEGGILHGAGWDLMADADVPFTLDLKTGLRI
ncbi:hypothetical protein [Silvibacterium dinghuense]|uniref:Uncharacterized protein n=1 Tax=Silvibacterium dinghuense TaxID=1560006 RepID=A0A4Q1SJ95_9BACT|nr:hypothetical protein [Silvibacterium dinghuense]RXS97708.1 hypothetical protein ESZ00_07510 [Silvibacterium dinghuense]GGH01331.1 hypothetical protein GCM10011586_16220 [Silvibacterium dinghuense]